MNENEQKTDKLPEVAPEIRKYLESLIVDKGIDNLPGDVLADVMYDLYVRFVDYLMINVSKAMPEDKYAEFEEMTMQETNKTKVETFIKENIDYQKVMDETFAEFRDIFLGSDKK